MAISTVKTALPTKGAAVPLGNLRTSIKEIAWAASAKYTSEGESLTATQLGLSRVLVAFGTVTHGDEAEESELFIGGAAYVVGTGTAGKLKLIDWKTGKELASEKKIAKVTVTLIAFGY